MSSKSAQPIPLRILPDPPPPSSRRGASFPPVFFWQSRLCKTHRARPKQSPPAKPLRRHLRKLHPFWVHDPSANKLVPPLRFLAICLVIPPNTPHPAPAPGIPHVQFESQPPSPPKVFSVQICLQVFAIHPRRQARQSYARPTSASPLFPASAKIQWSILSEPIHSRSSHTICLPSRHK